MGFVPDPSVASDRGSGGKVLVGRGEPAAGQPRACSMPQHTAQRVSCCAAGLAARGAAPTPAPSPLPRHHGWLQPLRGPAGRAEVHSHRHHPGHRHHLCGLYPSGLGSAVGEAPRAVAAGQRLLWAGVWQGNWVPLPVLLCGAGDRQGGCGGLCTSQALLDCPADISSVVLFGACIEGVVLRDK